MDERIRQRYTPAILQEAMRRYNIAPEHIRPLDAFESFIYEFERDQGAYILRLSHSLRRTEDLIHGEVDWINYLAGGGVSVAQAVPSPGGQLVEALDDGQGGQFLATVFVKAHGVRPWEIWTPALYETYGRLLGRMHALAEHYRVPRPAWQRPEWDDPRMEFVERYLPDSEHPAKARYRALLEHLHTLPRQASVYGLIHQDAHGSNFLVDEAGVLTLFDFDECVYSWYVNDIAIALFYIVMDAPDWPAFTREFMAHFLRGYRQIYSLDERWLKEIPFFLKLREIELYAVMYRDFDVAHIDDWWCARFMRERKFKIDHDVPYIEFDFESLSELCQE